MVRFKEIGSKSPFGSDGYTIEQFLVHCKSNKVSTCRINDLMARTDKLNIVCLPLLSHYLGYITKSSSLLKNFYCGNT